MGFLASWVAAMGALGKAAEQKAVLGLPFGWGAIFSLMTTIGGGAGLGIWLKDRFQNRKLRVDSETKLRDEMWKDIANLKTAKEDSSRRLTIAETKISEQSSELGQLRFVVALVNAELERVSPGNAIAKQVRLLMDNLQTRASSSTTEETAIMAEIIAKMCMTGAGE
jgi:hypothetical protein